MINAIEETKKIVSLERNDDINTWDTDQVIKFFQFANLFMKGDAGTEKLITTNKKKIMSIFDFETIPGHPYNNFIIMMDLTRENASKFDYRFKKMLNEVLVMLSENPQMITDELYTMMERNPNYSWALTPKNANSTQELAMDTVNDAMRIVSDLTRSIKKKDLMKLSTREKIGAIKQLWPVFELFKKNVRPAGRVFDDTNVSGAKTEDLEKKLLMYSEDNE